MSDVAIRREPTVAQVDRLIDENGAPLELPEDTALRVTDDVEKTVGGTGPTAWWRAGLIALGIVAAILLLFQLLMGGAGTDVVPGTTDVAPGTTDVAPGTTDVASGTPTTASDPVQTSQ